MRSTYDYGITQGNLSKGIWRLSWPLVLSHTFFMLPGLYDAIWLGRVGPGAQAAAALTSSLQYTMISILMALGIGSGAVVSRYVGARDNENANLAVFQGILLMGVAAVLLGLIGVLFNRPLMLLIGADSETLPFAQRYSRIIFLGLIAIEMLPSIGSLINAAGDPEVMLRMTILNLLLLLALEPIMVKQFGLEGAAIALVASKAAGSLYGLFLLIRGRKTIKIERRHIRLDIPMIRRIIRIAMPAVIQRGAPYLAMSVMVRFIAVYGAP
ncbi:MAG: hypothetical protein JXA42_13185, partial [Anaerolineales bacterium]|nr:hypothetical protein [Anaerolineales bacterium]